MWAEGEERASFNLICLRVFNLISVRVGVCKLILGHRFVCNTSVRAGVKSEQCRQIPDPGDQADLTRDSVSSAALNASQS